MKLKIMSIFLLSFLLISFASADIFILDESRARVNFDPAGDNDELLWSGFADTYLFKSSSLTLYRTDNFTTFPVFYSTGTGTEDFMAFTYDNAPLMTGGSPTYPSTMFVKVTASAVDSIQVFETNIFGVNDVNSVNSVLLNDVTPLAYYIDSINGLEFDTETNLLYVLYNSSRTVNVYDFYKPDGNYDASWVRTFNLDNQGCGYTHPNMIDLSLRNNQLYLLCGNDAEIVSRTIYSYSLLGDSRDTFQLNMEVSDLHSVTFSQDLTEMIIYDNTDNQIVFFEFTEQLTLGGGVVSIGGELYNTSGLCINNNQYSTNASIFINQFGQVNFDSTNEYIEWCSNGCLNVKDNNNIYQGQCQQNACTNECNDPNFDICETPNTYAICSVGIDGCTDLDSGLFCPANTICEDDIELGAQCIAQDLGDLGGLYIQPFISIDITANYTNVYEVLESNIDRTIPIITTPITTTLGPGIQSITNYFIKSFSERFFGQVKITGIQQLQETDYYGLACDFTDNYLEQDYLYTLNDITTGNTIQNISDLYYMDIDTTTTKTLETTSLSQKIEIMFTPIGGGINYIDFNQANYDILTLEITYDNVTNNLLIRDTLYNKLIVNETNPGSQDTLQRIVLITTHIKEADVNNVQIIVIRKINGIETEQIYYSLPIGYYSGNAQTPSEIVFFNTDNTSTLRLFQIIQREQSGFPTYTTNNIPTCEYTALSCTNQVAFVNDRNTPTYYFSEELVTCVNQLGAILNANPGDQPPTQIGELDFFESILGKPLDTSQKVLLSGVVLALVFAVFVFGYMETRANIVLIGGTVITSLFMLWFITIGYLPAWLILLFIAIGALLVVGIFKGGD